MRPKLIVILGPTASGKSSLAIKLAKKFKGEIVSADSRQVYRGMDIGTGKVTKKEQKQIRHHLLDVTTPKKQFTVSEFKTAGLAAIKKILAENKLPFLVGGTAFYIYAVTDNLEFPQVEPNRKLRLALEKKSTKELFIILKNLDARRAKTIDRQNKRRLIRAIEINVQTGGPVPQLKPEKTFDTLFIGIKKERGQIDKLIDKRLEARLKQGMIEEVKKLVKNGITFKRLDEMGLEYRYLAKYLKNQLAYPEMVTQLKSAIHKFARRQMTWFKRDKRIKWITNQKQAERLLKSFVRKTA